MEFLDFKSAKCKDCTKCLRECPVKAITIENHQAKIIEEKCILCGRCTFVCPQNAKSVHSELDKVYELLRGNEKVVASVAPSFIGTFNLSSFSPMRKALKELGFYDSEETAVGANLVTKEYVRLLETKKYKNFITSACPAINKMIQIYYPSALKYLAPVNSPMVAHAKILKEKYPDAKVVFIGPCIAKKREAKESEEVDAVLTFEEFNEMLEKANVVFEDITEDKDKDNFNRSKYYPISRGIIKSFNKLPDGYEYIALDGVARSFEVLEDIDYFSGLFIEVNCCEYACINGPCSIKKQGGAIKKNEEVRSYANAEIDKIKQQKPEIKIDKVEISEKREFIGNNQKFPTNKEIQGILAKTGIFKTSDELNCGACGYNTCREKAIAVYNGFAEVDMCLPYMRTRAESMSYEIIQNSPNGIIVMDNDYVLLDYNKAVENILGIEYLDAKGKYAYDCFDADEFVLAKNGDKGTIKKRIKITKTNKYADMTIVVLKEQKIIFGIYKDVTEEVNYNQNLEKVRKDTLETTDEVIKKQMRVAQEIASLLGETTAETKVALLKLKKTLSNKDKGGE